MAQIQEQGESAKDLKQLVEELGFEVGAALVDVLTAHPHTSTATEAARKFGISQPVMSRIVNATQASDPLIFLHRLPGSEPLRRLVDAASKEDIDPEIIQRAAEAISQLDMFISSVVDDQKGLDTLISGWSSEIRNKVDLRNYQLMYKSMCQLKGMRRNATVMTFFLDPTAEAPAHLTAVEASLGATRLRPGVRVIEGIGAPLAASMTSIEGNPIESGRDIFIDEFSSAPLPVVEIEYKNTGQSLFALAGEDAGKHTAVDIAWGTRSYLKNFGPGYSLGTAIGTPSRRWHVYVFVNKNLPFNTHPAYSIHDTAIYGMTNDKDVRDQTIIHAPVPAEHLGNNAMDVRCASMPNYQSLVSHVCKLINTDASDYVCFGVELEYPVYGSGLWFKIGPED